MNKLNPCAVYGCEDKTLSRHRFPKPTKNLERFTKWLSLCHNPHLYTITPLTVYLSHRVCQRHFLATDISRNNRLFATALPKLYLPDTITEQELHKQTEETRAILQCDIPGTPKVVASISRDLEEDHPELTNQQTQNVSLATEGLQNIPTKSPPKRRGSTILASLYCTRAKQLTPKKKILYNELKNLRRKLCLSERKGVSCKKRLLFARQSSKTLLLDAFQKNMDPIVCQFFRCQFRNKPKHPKGRRFTLDDKVMALSLLKESGKAFRMLSKIFALPSRQTLISLLNHIPLSPGINETLFNNITANVQKMKPNAKYCSLIFDEMALEPHVEWDRKKDYVIGVEDTGFSRTNKIADHALVFLIRGIFANWKQPIVYTFCEATTKATILTNLIKEIIKSLHRCGLKVLCTICDQGTTNVAAVNSLIKETRAYFIKEGKEFEDNFFVIDGHPIIPLYDPPHLLKGIRNNFLTKDITYINEENQKCTAKWQDIVTAYQIDAPSGNLRLMRKLTDYHVIPSKIRKMKVCFCTQIFSKQVACSIFRMSVDNAKSLDGTISMRTEAIQTAHLLSFFDELFDSVNGISIRPPPGKKYKCAVSLISGHISFWNKCIKALQTMSFLNHHGTTSRPPSLKNFIFTLKNMVLLTETANKLGGKLVPRRLNQDPLEHFFCTIRLHGGRNINPSCSNFQHYFKSLLVRNFISSKSIRSNCEEDNCSNLFSSLKDFVSQEVPSEADTEEMYIFAIEDVGNICRRNIDNAALGYVAGFICKHLLKFVKNCATCIKSITSQPSQSEQHSYITLREYEGAHLVYCNERFFNILKEIYNINMFLLPQIYMKKRLLQVLLHHLNLYVFFPVDCVQHQTQMREYVLKKFSQLIVYNYLTGANKVLNGKESRVYDYDSFYTYCIKKREKRAK